MNVKKKSQALRPVSIISSLILLAAILVGIFYFANPFDKLNAEGAGIAVIPFRNATGDESKNDFGIGIANEVSTKLALTKKFDFISSLQATLGFQQSTASPKAIGKELGVDYILTGFYQGSGNEVQVVAELSDAATGKLIWSLPHRMRYEDIFELQNKIANRVNERFMLTEKIDEKPITENLEAYAYYRKGIELWSGNQNARRELTKTEIIQHRYNVISQFRKAIQLDSGFQAAWTKLIVISSSTFFNSPYLFPYHPSYSRDTINSFVDYVAKKFPDSWEKDVALGCHAYWVSGDFDTAGKLFEATLSVNPEADVPLGALYKRKLMLPEAIALTLKSVNKNPEQPGYLFELRLQLSMLGESSSLIEQITDKMYQMDRNFTDELYGWHYEHDKLGALPNEVKKKRSKFYLLDSLFLERDHPAVIKTAETTALDSGFTMNARVEYKAISFYLLNQDDSARFYAQLLPDRSLASKFGLLCDEQKFEEQRKFMTPNFNLKVDLFMNSINLLQEFNFNIYCREFTKADEILRKMNRDYPQIGNYNWLTLPLYDRAKKEYPPLNETIKNLKYPEKLDQSTREKLEKLLVQE